jgi:hypothetical protein
VENFTDFLPSELDEIEKLVGQNGLLQKAPATSGKPTKPQAGRE